MLKLPIFVMTAAAVLCLMSGAALAGGGEMYLCAEGFKAVPAQQRHPLAKGGTICLGDTAKPTLRGEKRNGQNVFLVECPKLYTRFEQRSVPSFGTFFAADTRLSDMGNTYACGRVFTPQVMTCPGDPRASISGNAAFARLAGSRYASAYLRGWTCMSATAPIKDGAACPIGYTLEDRSVLGQNISGVPGVKVGDTLKTCLRVTRPAIKGSGDRA